LRRLDVILIVVLESEVSNQLLALHPAQSILQFHELDEDVVLGIESLSRHRRLEIERKPLLNASHSRALRQIHEQHQIQNERRREYGVAAQKIDLDLHRIAKPPENVDVIPTLLRIATGRVVVDTDLVVDVLVEFGVKVWLQNNFQRRELAFFFRFEGAWIVQYFAIAVAQDVRREPA